MSVSDRPPSSLRKLLIVGVCFLVVIGFIARDYFNRGDDGRNEAVIPAEPIFTPGPTTFAPGLHMLGALSPSVAYVVETSEGLILVDTGLKDAYGLVLQQFEALDLDIHKLKKILITHGHGDHYLGATNLQRLTGAKIYAGEGDSQVLREAGPREAVFSTFPMDNVEIHPTSVDVELRGGEIIEMGDARIRVISCPGHTPGSLCYLLEQNAMTALFSGDTIMTITGDLGTYATYLPPRYRGDAQAYLTTLRELEKLPVPDFLLPGHPRTQDRMISARLTPREWSSLLSRGVQQMEELTSRYSLDGTDFLDGNPEELLPGLNYLGDFSGIAVYCFSHRSSFILIDPSGEPEFQEFLERQLEPLGLDLSMFKAMVLTSVDPKPSEELIQLAQTSGCQIIAGPKALEEIQKIAPDADLLRPEDVAKKYEWFEPQLIPIEGFGRTTVAYQLDWNGKRILLTGKIPLKFTRETQQDLNATSFDVSRFADSLSRMRIISPDVWLPARPVHGQNANLYDRDWHEVLRDTRMSLGIPN